MARKAGVAFGEVGQIAQQGVPADLRSVGVVGWLGGLGCHGCVEVAVAVDQAAVDAGQAGDGGDADRLAGAGQVVERG
ncbi:hypothetical protein [Streptomyces angustmyceticus]|uniref:hypothetical protein n=1 Tax=Streptomyces angustmyceticus TaxID=285578 RepID=UPI00344C5041